MTAAITATRAPRAHWLAPAGLILLSLIPVLAGAARLGELTGGAAPTIHNARFLESPIPVVVHIVSTPFSASWAHSSSFPACAVVGTDGIASRAAC